MLKILFVCHGNICRSPMAEFVLKDMAREYGLEDSIAVASAATSTEEIGNPVDPRTVAVLRSAGIQCGGKRARQMVKGDYAQYDHLIGMDHMNVRNMRIIAGGDPEGKISRLLDFTDAPRDIADPWYTGDFNATYNDVCAGCRALLEKLK